MRTPTNAPPRHQGHQGAKRTTDTREDADTTSSRKPEIDLSSWSALGKPSRDRRQKKAWRRQHGGIDVSLAAWLVLLAVASLLLKGWLQ